MQHPLYPFTSNERGSISLYIFFVSQLITLLFILLTLTYQSEKKFVNLELEHHNHMMIQQMTYQKSMQAWAATPSFSSGEYQFPNGTAVYFFYNRDEQWKLNIVSQTSPPHQLTLNYPVNIEKESLP